MNPPQSVIKFHHYVDLIHSKVGSNNFALFEPLLELQCCRILLKPCKNVKCKEISTTDLKKNIEVLRFNAVSFLRSF